MSLKRKSDQVTGWADEGIVNEELSLEGYELLLFRCDRTLNMKGVVVSFCTLGALFVIFTCIFYDCVFYGK